MKLLILLTLLTAQLASAATQSLINIGVADNDGTGDRLRTAFAKVNTNFTALFLGTNYFPIAVGENLSYYASNSTPGTTLRLGPGIYDVGTNHIRLAHGVSLVGAGRDVTIISGNGSFQTNGCIVNPGSTSLVANLTIIASNRNVYFQAPIGCALALSDRPFTNASIISVRLIGGSDGWYVSTNSPTSLRAFSCQVDSQWDALAMQGSSAHSWQFYGCRFRSDGNGLILPNGISAGTATAVTASAGQVDLIGCWLEATNANDVKVINTAGAQATVTVTASRWAAAGTNTAFFADSASGGTIKIDSTSFTETEISGTVLGSSLMLTNLVYPVAAGLRLINDDVFPGQPIRIGTAGGIYVGSDSNPNGNLAVGPAGMGLQVKEGANATMGTAKFTSGAATISTTAVATNSRIMVIPVCTANAAAGVAISNIVAGTSFRVHSTSAADANRFDWIIFNPAP